MAWFLRFLATGLILYLAYAAVMVWLHPAFIYPFADEGFSDPRFQQKVIRGTGGTDVFVQVHDAGPDAPVVVYFMGNAGSLAWFGQVLDLHLRAGRSIVAMEYRGGGGRGGQPSEAVLKSDALAVFDAMPDLLPNGHGVAVLHGYSMGTGLALHLAAHRKVGGMMLDAPYARMCELMARASWLPACKLPFVQRWDNLALAGKADVPVLIQVGAEDTVIPPSQAERLAKALATKGDVVTMRLLPGRGHVDLPDDPGWAAAMADFIRSLSGA